MVNAKYIGQNESQFFRTVIGEKGDPRYAILQLILIRVLRGYHLYLNDFENLVNKKNSEFSSLEAIEKEALNHCYSTSTRSFAKMKGAIRNAQPTELKHTCPYCLIDRPTTLDHYIGKTEFPEFSILIKNLVPCCANCNNLKRETWRKNGNRQFIHYYNDKFLHKRFLHAKIRFPQNGKTPIVHYTIKKGKLTNKEFRIITSHFSQLDLFEFYQSKANSGISAKIETLSKSIKSKLIKRKDARKLLLSDTKVAESRLGVNFWEAVMYKAMANSPKLIRLL